MNLRYRANDMRPHFQMAYGAKFKPIGETEAMDPTAMLRDEGHLPDSMHLSPICREVLLTCFSRIFQIGRL